MTAVVRSIRSLRAIMAEAALALAPLMLRVALALPFYNSGLTKWSTFLTLSPAATFLFEERFKLHIFGSIYDLPYPDFLGTFDAVAEIVLPALLIVGFATRFSAFGLLIMTGVIQLVVPEGWSTYHLPWATFAVALIAIGPGPFSLDHLVDKHFNNAGLAFRTTPDNPAKVIEAKTR